MPYGRPVVQLSATWKVRMVSAEAACGAATVHSRTALVAERKATSLLRKRRVIMGTPVSFQACTAHDVGGRGRDAESAGVRLMVVAGAPGGHGFRTRPETAEDRRT